MAGRKRIDATRRRFDAFGAPISEAILPDLPPPPTDAKLDAGSEVPAELVALGKPPESAVAGQAWAYSMLLAQAHEVAMDPDISKATRRKEVRSILAAAARHYPDAARAELAKIIDTDRKQLEERKRTKTAAKLEARPTAAEGVARVIPIRG